MAWRPGVINSAARDLYHNVMHRRNDVGGSAVSANCASSSARATYNFSLRISSSVYPYTRRTFNHLTPALTRIQERCGRRCFARNAFDDTEAWRFLSTFSSLVVACYNAGRRRTTSDAMTLSNILHH